MKLRVGAVASVVVAVATAQASPIVVPVPGSDTLVVAVVFEHGYADDAPVAWGGARLCAEVRLGRARSLLPAGTPAALHVAEDRSVVFGALPVADAAAGVAFVRALLADPAAATEDEVALARARTALAADDDAWRFPGGMLQARARAALFADGRARPMSGSPTALLALDAAAVRDLLRRPVGASVAVFGAVDAVAESLRELQVPVVPRTAPARAAPRPPAAGLDRIEHPLVDAPFVALAFPAPAPEQAAAFAVGIELAKARAAARLPVRPEQLRAHAPTVTWSWLDGDPVVVFTRRARRPGPPEPVLEELHAFVAELRAAALAPGEVQRAATVLLAETGPLPWPEGLLRALRPGGGALPGRAVQALLAAGRGVERSAIADVDAASVAAALRGTLDPSRCWTGALVPMAAPGTGRIR